MSKRPRRDERRDARDRKRNPLKATLICFCFFLSACGKQVETFEINKAQWKEIFSNCIENRPLEISGEAYRKIVSDCNQLAEDKSRTNL